MLMHLFRELLADRRSRRLLAQARRSFQAGALDEAERICAACTEAAPYLADCHYLRGLLALKREQPALAVPHLKAAAELNDAEPSFHVALGETLQDLGAHEAAAAHLARALELIPADDPARPELMLRLAGSLQERGQFAEAERLIRDLLSVAPDRSEALLRLASIRFYESDAEQARTVMDSYVTARPGGGPRLRRALMLPVILQSNEEIDAVRRRFDSDLDRLLEERLAPIRHPESEVGLTPFYLAYHGRNNSALLRKVGRVYRALYPARSDCPRRPFAWGKRVRVGFVSTFFFKHSVGRTTFGLIRDLPREHFEVFVFAVNPKEDEIAAEIRGAAEHYTALPAELDRVRAAVEAAALDVLLFADIGMHPLTTFLSLWRLAPVQLVTWGHSVTSGIDTVDHYVSSDVVEAQGSEDQYTEKLIRLPGYFMPRYHRPVLDAPRKSREQLGLPTDRHLYYCAQNLFKLHPDFDSALAAILELDPRSEIVLVNSRASWMEQVRRRLGRSLGTAASRVRFLPRVPQNDFLQYVAAADVVIDPFHFGGCNTSCEALSLAVPIVTLPAFQLPGRFTLGLYREIELDACVARSEREFVEISVRLGTDPDYRRSISGQIAERCERLFERPDTGLALGEALLRMAEAAR